MLSFETKKIVGNNYCMTFLDITLKVNCQRFLTSTYILCMCENKCTPRKSISVVVQISAVGPSDGKKALDLLFLKIFMPVFCY